MFIGNDIVSLSSDDNRHSIVNRRYLEKIFTVDELSVISNRPDQIAQAWKYWSAKESVYKVLMKQGIKPFFAPKKIEFSHSDSTGHLIYRYANRSFTVRPGFHRDLVYSVAVSDSPGFDNMTTGFGEWNEGMSSPEIIAGFIAAKLNICLSQFEVNYLNGKIPFASIPARFGNMDLSFSHDHNKWMCAFILNS
jgi:phosphopantetheinyl transferase (holo-ACP synthase)